MSFNEPQIELHILCMLLSHTLLSRFLRMMVSPVGNQSCILWRTYKFFTYIFPNSLNKPKSHTAFNMLYMNYCNSPLPFVDDVIDNHAPPLLLPKCKSYEICKSHLHSNPSPHSAFFHAQIQKSEAKILKYLYIFFFGSFFDEDGKSIASSMMQILLKLLLATCMQPPCYKSSLSLMAVASLQFLVTNILSISLGNFLISLKSLKILNLSHANDNDNDCAIFS